MLSCCRWRFWRSEPANLSRAAIHFDDLTVPQEASRILYPHDSGDAVFSCHNRAVAHHPSNLHNQRASGQKQRRPARISKGSDQDFAHMELSAIAWVQQDARGPTRGA